MKKLLLILSVWSLGTSATEISIEEFKKVLEDNKQYLSKVEAGMTSKKVTVGTSVLTSCDSDGSCRTFGCDYKSVIKQTVLAVYGSQYYVHYNEETEDTSGIPECGGDYSENQLELSTKFTVQEDDFLDDVYKIEKVDNNAYTLYFKMNKSGDTQNVTIDVSKSLFYAPLRNEYNSSFGTISSSTFVEQRKDPYSFDLSNIELCFYYPVAQRSFHQECSDANDFSHILKDN